MRITGGKARGIPLKAPSGKDTRPATDRLRESVFSSLGPQLEGLRVADLFAGTGAYGLEALSRGAATVSFYENDPRALTCLKQNQASVLKSCQRSHDCITNIRHDLFKTPSGSQLYDLFFVDPPYDTIEEIITSIFENVIELMASEKALVIFELPGNLAPNIRGWQVLRRLGKSGHDQPSAAFFSRTL